MGALDFGWSSLIMELLDPTSRRPARATWPCPRDVSSRSATVPVMDTERDMNLTDEQWRERLSPDQYEVLRRARRPSARSPASTSTSRTTASTAAPGAAPSCSHSDTKFESGTGWPSFYEPAVAENVELHRGSPATGWSHRGPVPALRRAPGPRVRRRAAADRPALLHQLLRAGARPGRSAVSDPEPVLGWPGRRRRRGRAQRPARARRAPPRAVSRSSPALAQLEVQT